MDRVVVGRGGSHKVKIDVTDAGSTLKWEVVSCGYDIGFGVYLKTDRENGKTQKQEMVCYYNSKYRILKCVFCVYTDVLLLSLDYPPPPHTHSIR